MLGGCRNVATRYWQNRGNKTANKARIIGEELGSGDKSFRNTVKKLIFYKI
jgi:hypothetical protein